MKRKEVGTAAQRMSDEAFAGFLKLWLTPDGEIPADSPELEAYLRYVSEREPLTPEIRRALGHPEDRAA